MSKIKKRFAILFVALAVSMSAKAFLFAAAPVVEGVLWGARIISLNVTMAKAVEWSIWAHGALVSLWLWKRSSDAADTNTSSLKARLSVSSNPNAKRQNPDPTKWDDATTRNPTPKASFTNASSNTVLPSTWPLVVQDMGGAGHKLYISSTGSTLWDVTVTTSSNSSLSSSQQWSGSISGQTGTFYVYATSAQISCPAGYQSSGSNCVLKDATKVVKPAATVPCEVIQNSDGTWDVDSSNPECTNISSALTASGKTITYTRGTGDYDSITQTDTGYTVSTRGPAGNRDITTGPYDPNQGGTVIQNITDLGSGSSSSSSGGTASSSSGSSSGGTASSSSGGTSGSGGGSCGGTGQVACSIDDSGFKGADAIVGVKADAAISALDDRVNAINDQQKSDTFGIDTSWVPNLLPGSSPVACQPITFSPSISHGPAAGLSGSVNVDWCSKVEMFREFYAWAASISTVVAIALLFFGSNGNAKTK